MSEAAPEVPAEAPVEATPVVQAQSSNVAAEAAAVEAAPAEVRSFVDEVKALVEVVETGEKIAARAFQEALAAVKAHF